MTLLQRYRRLSFWNKFGVWGAFASIFSLLFSLLFVAIMYFIQNDKIVNEHTNPKNIDFANAPVIESKTTVSDFVLEFLADDWVKANGRGSQLLILFAEHKVNNPFIIVQKKEENGNLKDIDCEIEKDEFNNVIISIATDGFDGYVVMK